LNAYGGIDYVFRYGYDSLAKILDAAPENAHLDNEVILGLYCEYLSKKGRARRAQSILDQDELNFHKTSLFDKIELGVAIRLGNDLNEDKITRWKNLENHLPLDQPLSEGIYYNFMVIIFVRLNRIDEARSFGSRALESYGRAQQPYLQFFIHQHLADLAVVRGELTAARRHLHAARSYFDTAGICHGSERESMETVQLALDFENGKMEHIAERATEIRKRLSQTENVAEIMVQICRIAAMSIYFLKGRVPASQFLKDSQIDYHHSQGEFSIALDVIMANINLLDGRTEQARHAIDEAAQYGIYSALGTAVCESVTGKLNPAQSQHTKRPGNYTIRHKVVAELIKASDANANNQASALRKHVEQAMRIAVNEGLVELFLEHREVVSKVSAKLAKGTFARGHRQLARMARQIHRLVQSSYIVPHQFSDLGISTQQLRVLTALQNGASNKQVAQALGLTEATIKYHVANLFRKFNVSKRGELIEIIME
jgi:ATP/maltotriose-dependent transcriptional regulator MalT